MKTKAIVLVAIIAVASLALIYLQYINTQSAVEDEFYFGVSYGDITAQQAKVLIDKVKDFTNFFLINSHELATNETALNEVCDYAAQSNLKFVVYFDLISRETYRWHQAWLDTAPQRWGDKFLGVHLRDEPGGSQIDTQEFVADAANYTDAANKFVQNIASTNSMLDAKAKGIPLFTSDYALYWWDYLAGYDTVFAELGWNASSVQQIALCRGTANVQDKDCGTIITWTYSEPPYFTGEQIYEDMVLSYQAGAKYVVVFNHPTYPEDNPYGILSEAHFEAMEQFWNYKNANPRTADEAKGEAVLVLPRDYGWGMRRNPYITNDRIWGLWDEDEKAPIILNSLNSLLSKYGSKLDVVYEDEQFSYADKYREVYFWNSTIT